MYKIFWYECRRLLGNKFFFGILLILLFYGWQILDRVTILGVAHTAPFSCWSFGDYLSRRSVFSDFFHLRKGAAGKDSDGCCAHAAPAL